MVHWKWPFIVDFSIKNGDFPVCYVSHNQMVNSIHFQDDLRLACLTCRSLGRASAADRSARRPWWAHRPPGYGPTRRWGWGKVVKTWWTQGKMRETWWKKIMKTWWKNGDRLEKSNEIMVKNCEQWWNKCETLLRVSNGKHIETMENMHKQNGKIIVTKLICNL